MSEFRLEFTNGTIEATDLDETGPQLFGGQGQPPVFPYRRLRNLAGLSTRRVFWGERLGGGSNYLLSLYTLGDLILDLAGSDFPAPPGEQLEVYRGLLMLKSAHLSLVFEASVALRFPSPIDEHTQISGAVRAVQQAPAFPLFAPNMTATMNSTMPVRYGEPVAIYAVNNLVMRGKLLAC